MKNPNGISMLWLVGLISAAILVSVIRAAVVLRNFGREKRYFRKRMQKAVDVAEYTYWRRQWRCQLLCLIPFITEQKAEKLYEIVFRHPCYRRKPKRSIGLFQALAPSLAGICVCAVCLCSASWSWFTATVGTNMTPIRSAVFQLEEVSMTPENGEPLRLSPDEKGAYRGETASGSTQWTFRATENSARGYCRVTVSGGQHDPTVFYTAAIGSEDYVLILQTQSAAAVQIEPFWGDANERLPAGATRLESGDRFTLPHIAETSTPNEPETQPEATGNKIAFSSAGGVSASADSQKPESAESKTPSDRADPITGDFAGPPAEETASAHETAFSE